MNLDGLSEIGKNKTALVLPHLGLGDMIHMNGFTRYLLSTDYEIVYLFCKNHNIKAVSDMYSDELRIKLVGVSNDECINFMLNEVLKSKKINTLFLFGFHAGMTDFSDFPNCFYKSINLEPCIRWNYFKISENLEQLEVPEEKYIFVHTLSSTGRNTDFLKWDLNENLTIDPTLNHYKKEDKWFHVADRYVNKPFFSFMNLIKNATELHVVDSSIQCLATYLKLNARVAICYDRSTGKKNDSFSSQLSSIKVENLP